MARKKVAAEPRGGENPVRRDLSDAERIRMARLKFSIYPGSDSFYSLHQIARLTGRNATVVSRAISSAFKRGLVEIRESHSIGGERSLVLERQLRDRFPQSQFPHLRHIAVIECGQQGERTDEVYSDYVHACLGSVLAKDLAEGYLISSNKSVGLGSGRSVFHTVDALRRYEKVNWGSASLVSLSGNVQARARAEDIVGHLDADFHVNLMGLCLQSPAPFQRDESEEQSASPAIQLRKVGRFISDIPPDETARPFGKDWTPPDYAIVGVGALSLGNRFLAAEKEHDGAIEKIRTELSELIAICDRAAKSLPGYCPVGDICNRLYFVGSPTGNLPPLDEDRIKQLIFLINDHLLTVPLNRFGEIDNVLVLAGTSAKAYAVRELITTEFQRTKGVGEALPSLNIQRLYVDTELAHSLLDLDEQYRRYRKP